VWLGGREYARGLGTASPAGSRQSPGRKGNPSGDHFALVTKINVSKPPKQRKAITYRKYRDIDISDLTDDLRNISNP
jgi:hypothetical protein